MFSQHTLDEIRNRADIVEVVGEYVQLKKSGQNYQGLCPFHSEKTPSFNVNPAKQIYHCFGGCSRGGNVFTFLTQIEGISFPEAVKRLAKKVGVTIEETWKPRTGVPQPGPTANDRRILEAMEWAARYFNHLLTTSNEYKFALDYLKKRGLTDKSIEKFRLGVSPKGWSTLLTLMQKRGYTWEILLAAGLVKSKPESPTKGYDTFRSRLMFPILDQEGNTVAFGARSLSEEDQPKYLNSSETPVFSKGKILYGLYENQRDIRLKGETVVVEGYMDVVGLYESGVGNAVAPMGTALTEDHCQILKTFSPRVVTVFDPDEAGNQAWHRTVPMFLKFGMFAKDVSLPKGMDPDEFVKKNSAEDFYKLCDTAPQQITKYLKEIANKGMLGEKERSKYLQELAPILTGSRRLPDKGALLWDDVSRVLNVSIEALKKMVDDSRMGRPELPLKPTPSVIPQKGKAVPSLAKSFPLDWEFFSVCVRFPDLFWKTPEEDWKGLIRSPKLATLLETLWQSKTPESFQATLESIVHSELDPELQSLATTGLVEPSQVTEGSTPSSTPFESIAVRIRQRRREAEIQSLAAQVKLSQRMGNMDEQMELLKKLRDLRTSPV